VIPLFKRHIGFADDFEVGMSAFVTNRNIFAHDFLSLPGFSVNTEEIAVGIGFLKTLINQADLLTRVMLGLNEIFSHRDGVADISGELTNEKFNEMLALMMLRRRFFVATRTRALSGLHKI
jgi:hypothetical protein